MRMTTTNFMENSEKEIRLEIDELLNSEEFKSRTIHSSAIIKDFIVLNMQKSKRIFVNKELFREFLRELIVDIINMGAERKKILRSFE